MKVKLVNPANAAGLLDPHTKRSPFIDPATKRVLEIADVPESSFWIRRLTAGEVVRTVRTEQPTAREPVAPLTTR